jgi:glucose/arabinose dehydrogenase
MRKLALGTVAAVLALAACSTSSPKATPSTAPISPAPTTTTTTKPGASSTNHPTTTTTPNLPAVHLGIRAVVTGLSSPVVIAFRPGGKGTAGTMYVAEQTGTLRRIVNGHASPTPALDLRANLSHGNEQGFLGAAFSPDAKFIYVSYTDAHGDTNVDAYTMRGPNADASTLRRVFFASQPYANHNGGEIATGPDGMLYIGLGDGGSEDDPHGYGQSLATPLSKILRINPAQLGHASYSVPADNPFVGHKGVVPETWMWGLRNPWRFSFDRATGDLWIGDVGQDKYEEIDYAPHGQRGINWGWSAREGFHEHKGARPAGERDPIVEAPHADGYCAIVGGYVYRGHAFPALDGVYLYGDNCRPNIEGLVQRGGRAIATRNFDVTVPELTSFGEDGTGELYVAARGETIYRIVAN